MVILSLVYGCLGSTPIAPESAATLAYVAQHWDDSAGAYRPSRDQPASVRATNAALRVQKYLQAPQKDRSRPAAFVLRCYDPTSGRFADTPGGASSVLSTAIGVMAAVECGIPPEQFAGAKTFLRQNASSFEEIRLAAAAWEALGLSGATAPAAWKVAASQELQAARTPAPDQARRLGSAAALLRRLDWEVPQQAECLQAILAGQRTDGAWGTAISQGSDLDSTYRVMRAIHLLQSQPANGAALRQFLRQCRHTNGGYASTPDGPPSLAATYTAVMVQQWLR